MRTTILLYGDSGDGKTPQIGELAEAEFADTRRKSVIYAGDMGGWKTVAHLVKAGIMDVVDLRGLENPFNWLSHIAQGHRLDAKGQWVNPSAEEKANVGVYGFEGFTAFAEIAMQNLAGLAAENRPVGGASAINIRQGDTTFAGNNQAHYGIVQQALQQAAFTSFRLPGEGYIVWTASARRAADNDTNSPILGPQIIGKAMTSEAPRWFVYTFRLMAIPADPLRNQKEEHRLYWGDHTDATAAGSKGLGNSRLPLDVAHKLTSPYQSPAKLSEALAYLEGLEGEAEELVRKRLGLEKKG